MNLTTPAATRSPHIARMRRYTLLVATSMAATGCDALGIAVECKDYAAAALAVFVYDSATGAPLTDPPDLEVRALDGGFADTARFHGPRGPVVVASLAFERAGTYRVEAAATGYHDWVREGVRVREDRCHVQTQSLNALMQRR